MLLMLLEKKMKVNEVVFYDTEMEFQAIYNTRDKIIKILEEQDIKYTELKPKEPFLYKMLSKPVQKKDGTKQYGYGPCGGICRWGTTEKLNTISRYLKNQYGKDYREYIGIASDETERIKKERDEHKVMPLVDWGMTEKNCLDYCYKKGFLWLENGVELYSVLDRVSCWCCANKNKKELENMRLHLPEYYLKNIDLLKQIKTNNKRGSFIVEKAKQQFMKY